jgi:hypothetical protein
MMEFKEKFIAFIDILGFKQLVAAAERGEGMPLHEILELSQKLGRSGKRQFFEKYGSEMCPAASFVQRDLDFRATQISDCVVLSTEISPAGGINLISQAWSAVTALLTQGLLCRGYITRGMIYHTDAQFIGTGYQKAVEKEKAVMAFSRNADDRGTPFVEVDAEVRDYLVESADGCVREMFSRLVKDDGTVTAVFPFQALSAKFMIDHSFDAAMQKKSNQNLRISLQTMKEKMMKYIDRSNPSAVLKSEHYVAALDAQLKICDRTDQLIDALCRPFPSRRARA